jgi:hypothetical protein
VATKIPGRNALHRSVSDLKGIVVHRRHRITGASRAARTAGPTGSRRQRSVTSSTIYTIPGNGAIAIQDSRITATSVVLLQYVGGDKGKGEFGVETIINGGFTGRGQPKERFRYVIIN